MTELLSAEGLRKEYATEEGFLSQLLGLGDRIPAVNGVDISIEENEVLGLVGESGCGKTTLGKTLIRLEDPTDGTIRFRDEELTALSSSELKRRRADLQMIFQDPASALNPRRTIGSILGRPLKLHTDLSKSERQERIREILDRVNLDPNFINRYPHQFSGGQQQRIGIARALITNPQIVVADEPTSALDVSVQSAIINLLNELKEEMDMTMIFITHDLSVVRHIADRLAVMYLGELVEIGPTEEVYTNPTHPYTRSLLSAIPYPDPDSAYDPITLEGSVPSPTDRPTGCSFHPRCPATTESICSEEIPEFRTANGSDHRTKCHLFDDKTAMEPLEETTATMPADRRVEQSLSGTDHDTA